MISTIFSQKEIEYIKSQRLARIATAPPSVPSSKEEGEPGGLHPYNQMLYLLGLILIMTTFM